MEDTPARVPMIVPARAPGGSLTVALARSSPITICSELAGVLPWLEEMLAPGFTVLEDTRPELRVLIGSGEAQNTGEGLRSSFPCFALDTEVRRLPGRTAGSSFVLEDERFGSQYEVGPGVVRLSPLGPNARVRAAALRVVREMATVRALAAGGRVQLHASCVAWEGRCLVLAGPKRAGKTTLLARLTASTGAEIVANDRVILHPTAHGWHVTGVPTVVSVRPGTMRCLPDLFQTVPAVTHPVDLTIREATLAASRFGTVTKPSHLSLSPAQLACEVGSTLSPGSPLACLAVIGVDPTVGDFEVRRLSREEAAQAIAAVRYGADVHADAPTVFERVFARGLQRPATEPPERDLSRSPWLAIGVSERFLTSPSAPQKLLRMVFEE